MFIARGKEDALVTKNIVPGESVYGEKRISVDVRIIILYLYSKNFEDTISFQLHFLHHIIFCAFKLFSVHVLYKTLGV